MIYEYECPGCGKCVERYVPTFEKADGEFCECGAAMTRIISTPKFKVWNQCHIEEIDPNINVRSLKHAKQLCRERGLFVKEEPMKGHDVDYAIKQQEKAERKSGIAVLV